MQQPSVTEARRLIQNYRRIDMRSVDVDGIKEQIKQLIRGYSFETYPISAGQRLFRGIRYAEQPGSVSGVSYPPRDVVRTYVRLNRPHQSVFYSAVNQSTVFFELSAQAGEHFALSRWTVQKKFMISNVGHSKKSLEILGGPSGEMPIWIPRAHERESSVNRMIRDFFSTEFVRAVKSGQEHLYKLPIAIAEKHYCDPLRMPAEDPLYSPSFGGILYPSIADLGRSDNVVLLPAFVDSCLELTSVDWILIEEATAEKVAYRVLDFACVDPLSKSLLWQGRPPDWQVRPGEQVVVEVVGGALVVKNQDGSVRAQL